MISILILTYQEERNLPRCLQALTWCDDIVILDSFSTDRTVTIAQQFGCRVIQRAFDNFSGQRNHGLEHGALRHDWVLHLDADEVVTPALRDELLRVVGDPSFDAYRVPARTMYHGVWLKHAALPSYQVRFGRRDLLRFTQVGHGQRETLPRERIGMLREAYEHHSFDKGLADWVEKHNRYSSDEARHALAAGASNDTERFRAADVADPMARFRTMKRISRRMPFRPALRFLYMYFWRLGFLDGRAGYRYCRLAAVYEFMIVTKMRELQRVSQRESHA